MMLQYIPHLCKDSILVTLDNAYKSKTLNKVQRAFNLHIVNNLDFIIDCMLVDVSKSNPTNHQEVAQVRRDNKDTISRTSGSMEEDVFYTVTTDKYFKPGSNIIEGLYANRLNLFGGTAPYRAYECEYSEDLSELWYGDDWDTEEYIEYMKEKEVMEVQKEVDKINAKHKIMRAEYIKKKEEIKEMPLIPRLLYYLTNKLT